VIRPERDALVEAVADRIVAGQVVAWCHGRMEFGPRALGNRSIPNDPCSPRDDPTTGAARWPELSI